MSLLSLTPGRAVWSVAWPMAALGLCRSAYHLTDSFWVGRIGPEALAALGGSAFAWWMITLACSLAGTGTHALVARHEGAAQATGQGRERINRTLAQGLWVGFAVAIVLVLIYPVRGYYFDLLGFARGSDEHLLGQEYIGVSLLAASTLAAHTVIGAVFRGIGDTRTILIVTIATVILNGALDPLLIWGFGPIPALGVGGAAWATAISNAAGAAFSLWVLKKRGVVATFAKPMRSTIRRIIAIGLPTSAGGIGFSLVYVVLGRYITDFGTAQMGALGVGHRLEGLAFLVCVGFEVGTATMVGQHLGAGNADGARRSVRAAVRLCSLAMVPLSVFLFLGAAPLMGLFTDDPTTIAAGALYLQTQSVVIVFMGIETVYRGAFAGAGNTVPSFLIEFGWTAFRIPLAWALAYPLGLGIFGVWLAIAVTTVIKAGHLVYWFRLGRWVAALETV